MTRPAGEHPEADRTAHAEGAGYTKGAAYAEDAGHEPAWVTPYRVYSPRGVLHDARYVMPGFFIAVHARHTNIHEDHIGAGAANQLKRTVTIFCVADNHEIGLRSEQRPKALSHHRLVVDDCYADGCFACHASILWWRE